MPEFRFLEKTINKIKNSGLDSIKARYRYERLQYSFVILEGKKKIKVYKREVYWKGHEEEIKEMFGGTELEVDDFEYEDCKGKLTEFLKTQREFIRENRADCKKEKEAELFENRTK